VVEVGINNFFNLFSEKIFVAHVQLSNFSKSLKKKKKKKKPGAVQKHPLRCLTYSQANNLAAFVPREEENAQELFQLNQPIIVVGLAEFDFLFCVGSDLH
jgi:hypothetical protein